MKGLLFGVEPETDGSDLPEDTPELVKKLAMTPMGLRDLDDPKLPADDWVVIKTRMTGICGSDSKQVFLDGDPDSPMTAVISFPQVLGHEMVGDIVEAGPTSGRAVGERVVLNPWLSCGPRGISPQCPACDAGDVNLCYHFTEGHLQPGIHSGNSADATGGFAELVPAHTSMAIPCPDGLGDEVAVLADPFSVALHSVLRNPPPPGGTVLVYGVGALGLTTCAILEMLHPDVDRRCGGAVPTSGRARCEARRQHVRARAPRAARRRDRGVDASQGQQAVARTAVVAPRRRRRRLRHRCNLETLEVGVRVARARGKLVITGVASPARFEWSPWYFKELSLIGSNAFGMETVDGVRRHAIAHYLDWANTGRVDVRHMLTHTYRLDQWRDAFGVLARQGDSGALKVAFDFR